MSRKMPGMAQIYRTCCLCRLPRSGRFTTRRGFKVCVQPGEPWVPTLISKIEDRKRRQ